MRNIKLIIEYDGTRYHGWQKQPNVITVQEEIERAIYRVTGEEVNLIGSGRTDRGVHAKGQVANFFTESRIPADKFSLAINSSLPEDISIKHSEEVDINFHARYSAKGKEYKYLIYSDKTRSPLLRNFAYHVPYNIDLSLVKKAAKYFTGTHDFKGFMSSGSSIKDTIRTIYDIKISKEKDVINFSFTGNGFLYNMVRIIVGTLVDVGNGKINVSEIPDIISSCDRNRAGHTAPPQGLYLEKVFYNT